VEGDLHLNEFVTAALVNLDNWARNGIAAPSADNHWLQADADNGKAVARDAYGNALAGCAAPRSTPPWPRILAVSMTARTPPRAA
jgi:hypothetical protein